MSEPNEKQMRKGRGSNPNSRANLKPFTPGHKLSKGRPPGYKERGTVFEKWLGRLTKIADPSNPKGPQIEVPLYEAAALGQIRAAMNGNTRAFQEIQDTLHGKMVEPVDVDVSSSEFNVNVTCNESDKAGD